MPDNSGTHKHRAVQEWLRHHPRFHLHFTPTSISWMNQGEPWFSLLECKALRPGVFHSVAALRTAIQRFLDAWNERKHPFAWVKTAEQILAQTNHQPISVTGHLQGAEKPLARLNKAVRVLLGKRPRRRSHMRGSTTQQVPMVSVLTPEELGPEDHPLRRIKVIVDRALAELNAAFAALYSRAGRRSIALERLPKPSLLMALDTVRSERQFCERLRYDMLFKWFLHMNISDTTFDQTTFSKYRERLLDHEVARRFFNAVRAEAERRQPVSDDHYTVDWTFLEAWASVKSARPKDDHKGPPSGPNPAVDFHGQRRRSAPQWTNDPAARLAQKSYGTSAKPSYAGHPAHGEPRRFCGGRRTHPDWPVCRTGYGAAPIVAPA